MLASAFGALVAVSLGNYVSSNWLVLWGMIGAFIGFVSVGPKEFFVQMHREFISVREIHRIRKAQRIEEERRLKETLAPFAEHIQLEIKKSKYRFLDFVAFTSWLGVALVITLAGTLGLKVTLTLVGVSFTATIMLMALIFGVASYHTYYEFVLPRYASNSVPDDRLQQLIASVESERKSFMVSLTLPLWPILHVGFLLRSAVLILSKTCAAIVSFERWTAVIGSIGGFIVGWGYGHSEIIAMFAGAFIGGATYALSKTLLQFLPDPQNTWPSLSGT